MFGARTLINAVRNGVSSWKLFGMRAPLQMDTSLRALSTMKAPLINIQQRHTTPRIPDMKLVSKRFLHQGNRRTTGAASSSSEGTPFTYKMLAAAGTLLVGIGTGALFHNLVEPGRIFRDFARVSCAAEDDCVEQKCEDSICLRKMDREEELILKANADLEKALKDIKTKAIEYTEAAMKAYCEAIIVMKEYMDQGYCIIDADELESPRFEEGWCCVYEISKRRYEKVKDALQKGQCAWELLCRLRDVIEAGKACKYTSCNPLLVTAEESLTCAERELLGLKAKMDCITSEHEMVEIYRSVIEDFRKDLKADVEAVGEECKLQYTEQETALMINMAYKRVVRAHKEMAQVLVCTGRIPERQQNTVC